MQMSRDLPRIIDIMKSLNGRCVIQTMFMKGEWQGKSVDNTGDEYVLPWLEVVKAVAPRRGYLYDFTKTRQEKGSRRPVSRSLTTLQVLSSLWVLMRMPIINT